MGVLAEVLQYAECAHMLNALMRFPFAKLAAQARATTGAVRLNSWLAPQSGTSRISTNAKLGGQDILLYISLSKIWSNAGAGMLSSYTGHHSGAHPLLWVHGKPSAFLGPICIRRGDTHVLRAAVWGRLAASSQLPVPRVLPPHAQPLCADPAAPSEAATHMISGERSLVQTCFESTCSAVQSEAAGHQCKACHCTAHKDSTRLFRYTTAS